MVILGKVLTDMRWCDHPSPVGCRSTATSSSLHGPVVYTLEGASVEKTRAGATPPRRGGGPAEAKAEEEAAAGFALVVVSCRPVVVRAVAAWVGRGVLLPATVPWYVCC